jgi:hypothetical protein
MLSEDPEANNSQDVECSQPSHQSGATPGHLGDSARGREDHRRQDVHSEGHHDRNGSAAGQPAIAGKPTTNLLVPREIYLVPWGGWAAAKETRRRCQRFRNSGRHGIDS